MANLYIPFWIILLVIFIPLIWWLYDLRSPFFNLICITFSVARALTRQQANWIEKKKLKLSHICKFSFNFIQQQTPSTLIAKAETSQTKCDININSTTSAILTISATLNGQRLEFYEACSQLLRGYWLEFLFGD